MKKRQFPKFIISITLVVVLAIGLPLVGGCRPAPPEEVEPIKVGAPFALTGYAAEDAVAYMRGLELAVDDINAEGGLLGRPIELIYFDIGDFAPETLVLAADQLVGADKVDAVMTAWAGWGQDVRAFGKYDVPYFHANVSLSSEDAAAEPGNDNCFQATDTQASIAKTFYDAMVKLPYEYPNNKVAIIGGDDDYCRGVVEGFREEAEADGWEVVMFEIVPYGTMEWGPILTKVRAEEPALLHIEIVSPPDVAAFFRQFMHEPTPTILDYGWSLPPAGFMAEMGEEADGILGVTGCFLAYPPPTQEVADWVERYETKFGVPPIGGSNLPYEYFMMWAEAVRQVGDPTDYAAIVEWLKTNTFQAMPGMRVVDFDERNSTSELDWPMTYVQVQNGEWFTLSHDVYGDPYVDYQGKSYEFLVPRWIE